METGRDIPSVEPAELFKSYYVVWKRGVKKKPWFKQSARLNRTM